MTDFDDELKRRYRALATEEPSAVIDAAILAHSRRRRPWIARWAGPVSIAAVLVLGIGVSLRMQLEQPGVETSVPDSRALESSAGSAPATPPLPAIPASKDEARRDAFVPSPSGPAVKAPQPALAEKKVAPVLAPKAKEAPQELKERFAAPAIEANVAPQRSAPQSTTSAIATSPPPAPAAAAPPPAAAPAFAPSPPRNEPAQAPLRAKQEAESDHAAQGAVADSSAGVRALAKPFVETDPGRELERIAKLRESGDDAAADTALAEFRKRFPDFRIPDTMWERVKPR
jgi:hypothetical protein